jgi:hypothetical protein
MRKTNGGAVRRLAIAFAVFALGWLPCAFSAEERPAQSSPTVEDDRWKGYVAFGLFAGGVYAIGKQDNGEKVLGSVWLMAVGVGHGSKEAGMGLLALSAYNFFYLTRGDISNERVPRDNLIGVGLLLGLAYLADHSPKARSEPATSANAFVVPDPERRRLVVGVQRSF